MLIDLARNDIRPHRADRQREESPMPSSSALLARDASSKSNVEGPAQAGHEQPGRAARHLPGRHADRCAERSARWRSSTSSPSPSSVASTAAPAAASASPATWFMRPSPSAPASSGQRALRCRLRPRWWPTRCPSSNGARPRPKARALIRAAELVEGVLTEAAACTRPHVAGTGEGVMNRRDKTASAVTWGTGPWAANRACRGRTVRDLDQCALVARRIRHDMTRNFASA